MIYLITGVVLFLVALMYLMNDLPNWDNAHSDSKKGSFYEISNRKNK